MRNIFFILIFSFSLNLFAQKAKVDTAQIVIQDRTNAFVSVFDH